MPTVDVTFQPIVVEAPADVSVVEFTDNSVVVEVSDTFPVVQIGSTGTLIPGPGLTGGGYMAGNVSLDLSPETIASLALADTALQPGSPISTFTNDVGYLTEATVGADYQPVNTNLTFISNLTTTVFGRSFLELADAAAARTLLGVYSTSQVYTQAEVGALLAAKAAMSHTHSDPEIVSVGWSKLTGIPATFPPGAHTHVTTDITSGQFDWARMPTGVIAASIATQTVNSGVDSTGTFQLGSASAISREQRFRLVNSVKTAGVDFILTGDGNNFGIYDRNNTPGWVMQIAAATRDATFIGNVYSPVFYENGVSLASKYAQLGVTNTFAAPQRIEGTGPWLGLRETDQAVDEKQWLFYAQTKGLYIRAYDDATNLSRNILTASRGTGIAITAMSYGNNTDNPSHTFYGGMTVNGNVSTVGSLTAQGVEGELWLYETDAAVNEKRWRFVGSIGNLYCQAWNDAVNSATTFLTVHRTGMTIDSLAFSGTTMTLNGTEVSVVGHAHTTSDITNLSAYTGFDARYYTESEITSLLAGKADTHTHPYLALTGGTLTGNVTASEAVFRIDSAVNALGYELRKSGTPHWMVGFQPGTGTNGDFGVWRFDQTTGAYIDRPFVIGSNGRIALNANSEVTGTLNVTSTLTQGGTAVSLAGHAHAISDVTGLQSALDGKVDSSHTHSLANLTDFGVDGGYVRSNGTAWVRVSGVAWADLTGVPSTFTPSAHTHAIADVTGLQTALDGKAASSHTHGDADITALAWNKLTGVPATFPPSSHTHGTADITNLSSYTGLDARYYTESEVDSLLNAKAPLASPSFSGTAAFAALTTTGNIELGHASDTTIARIAAGRASLEGVEIGYRQVPALTYAATAAVDAVGKCYTATGNITIPASTFAAGDAFSIYNNSAGNITITQGSGLTLRLSGTATVNDRTLAQRGMCTIWFLSATEAVISGAGLT